MSTDIQQRDPADMPPGAAQRKRIWYLGGRKKFVDAEGKVLDADEQLLIQIGELDAEIETLSAAIKAAPKKRRRGDGIKEKKRRLKKARVQRNKLNAKFETGQLLKQKRFGKMHALMAVSAVFKFLTFFPICLFAGKLTVTGFYDLLWETHVPLRIFGGIWIAIGVGIFIWAVRAKMKRGGKSPYAAMVLAVGFIAAGVTIEYIKAKVNPSLTDNTAFWHWWVHDDAVRHLLFRAWPEGLLGGLYWAFFNWNSLKRRAKPHWLTPAFEKMGYASLADDDPAAAWQLTIVPAVVILFALPVTLAFYYSAVKHQTGVHAWIHSVVPWHVDAMPSDQSQAIADKLVATVTASWPVWIIGLLSANFYGRVAAFGAFDDLQQVLAWKRIAKKGSLHGALAFWQMSGYQARIIAEYNTGAAKAGLEGWPEGANEAAVAYAKEQLVQVGPTVTSLFKIVVWSQVLLIPLGALYLYGPLGN